MSKRKWLAISALLVFAGAGLCVNAAEKKFPPVGLVGYWDFNEGRGNIINDQVGWIGKMKGFGSPKWVKNVSGYCMWIDNREGGEPVYLELPTHRVFGQKMANGKTMNACGSLSLWAMPVDGGCVKPYMMPRDRRRAAVFYATIMIRNFRWQYNVGDPMMRLSFHLQGPKVESGKWTHVAGTWDGINTRLYVNGKLMRQPGGEVINNSISSGMPKDPFRIGLAYPWQKHNRYNGYLDELKYYSRVLTEEEIRKQYEEGREKVQITAN